MTMMSFIIVATLAVLIVGALISTIADQFIAANRTGDPTGADPQGNLSGATGTIAALVPVMLLIGVVLALWRHSGEGKS